MPLRGNPSSCSHGLRHRFAPCRGSESEARGPSLVVDQFGKRSGAAIEADRPTALAAHLVERHLRDRFFHAKSGVAALTTSECPPSGRSCAAAPIFLRRVGHAPPRRRGPFLRAREGPIQRIRRCLSRVAHLLSTRLEFFRLLSVFRIHAGPRLAASTEPSPKGRGPSNLTGARIYDAPAAANFTVFRAWHTLRSTPRTARSRSPQYFGART